MEAEEDMREQDVREIKDGIKEIQKTVQEVDKTVSIHTEKFNNLGDIKEKTESTVKSAEYAHQRIDKVEGDMKKQFKEFKELVENSNKMHEQNYKGMKTFAWKVFFLFAAPFSAGLGAFCWFIFKNGLGMGGQ
jgi:chromosome segregation ATPase